MANLPARADALWRAITYIAVAQLHLTGNPLLARPLEVDDMKARPAGHWGTVPGSAWALTHVGFAAAQRPDLQVVPVIGAGHAGVVQIALGWLTGDLAKIRSLFTVDAKGLAALVASFPQVDGMGSEVHPSLPAGGYVGGWLGGALAFAQGAGLDAPSRVVVPIIGDGECETPTTAGAWLAQRALGGVGVLPIVHLNGYRMGSPSLLDAMSDEEVRAYAVGLGWEPVIANVIAGAAVEHSTFHRVLVAGIDAVRDGDRRVIFMRCVKGWSGPTAAHKTPLTDLAHDSHQHVLLRHWLSSYRPGELFNQEGQPIGALAEALDEIRICDLPSTGLAYPAVATPGGSGFSAEVSAVLRAYAEAGDFKVFSPDELASNRLGELATEPWAHELLAEEVLLGWLAGWTASGRRGVLISYEAFAPLLLTGLIGHLKQRRLADPALPSMNLLLTSYGWHNAYTHGDPSLITALLATGDPAVRVFTSADTHRTAVAVEDALRSTGRVNIIIAGKHTRDLHPPDTMDEERTHGLAIWPHLSDDGEPDLTLVCAGDLPATVTRDAVERIRNRHQCRIRVVNVHDLAALAGPALDQYVGDHAFVLITTLGHPAAIWGLLAGRLHQPTRVIGWREPPRPMTQPELAAYAGLDIDGITNAATALLCGREA